MYLIKRVLIILTLIYFIPINGRFTKLPEHIKTTSLNLNSANPNQDEEVLARANGGHININDTHIRHKRERPTYSEQLHHVGIFIAAHKYFGFDGRKRSGIIREFYRNFPVPPLKSLHSKLEESCEKNVIQCILAIHNVITDPGTSTMYPLLHKKLPPLNWPGYYPFENWATFFGFRATASYFMCWYTMKKEDILAHFMKEKNCLLFLNRVQESRTSGITVFDWRSDEPSKPYQCAEIMFCPNPCYGRRSGGSILSAAEMNKDKGNPCIKFTDKTCTVIPEFNLNLMGMVKNKLNYTCRCSNGKEGVYNARTGACDRTAEGKPKSERLKRKRKRKKKNNADVSGTSNMLFTFVVIHVLMSVVL